MPRHELPAGFLFWMVFFRLACASPVLIAAGVVLYLHFTGESMNTVDEQTVSLTVCCCIPEVLVGSVL